LPTLKKKNARVTSCWRFFHIQAFFFFPFFFLGAAPLLTGCVIPQVLSPPQLFWNGIVCELRLFLNPVLGIFYDKTCLSSYQKKHSL
jgi:hypothetical protein